MKEMDSSAVDAIEGTAFRIAAAMQLSFGTTYRLWSGDGNITIDGNVFTGIGASALIAPINSELGGSSTSLEVSLSNLDPVIAATIEAEDYHQKPAITWRLIYDETGTELLDAVVFHRGRVDTVIIREQVDSTSTLQFTIEGPARDMDRSGSRMRSDADQRILGGATDGGMKNVSIGALIDLAWGNKPDKVAAGGAGNGVVPGLGTGRFYKGREW